MSMATQKEALKVGQFEEGDIQGLIYRLDEDRRSGTVLSKYNLYLFVEQRFPWTKGVPCEIRQVGTSFFCNERTE
jgi:hypothetical protein